jgi:hypothetical protein
VSEETISSAEEKPLDPYSFAEAWYAAHPKSFSRFTYELMQEKPGGDISMEVGDEEGSAIIQKAAQYGEKVRLAEDALDEAERKIYRVAWVEFLNSIRRTPLEEPARAAYWDAYGGTGYAEAVHA